MVNVSRLRRGLWREVEIVIRANQHIQPATVTGVGMEDVSRLVLEKYAGAGASSLGNSVMS